MTNEKREIKFRAWDSRGSGNMYYKNPGATIEELENPPNHCVWMQYTGLKDKNGKEIYESDIVVFIDYPTGVENGVGEVYYKDCKWKLKWSMIPLGDFSSIWLEVIGNIYENPNLLTK